jgi:hypothetical protein
MNFIMKFKGTTYSTWYFQFDHVFQSSPFFQKKRGNRILIWAQNDSIVHKKIQG